MKTKKTLSKSLPYEYFIAVNPEGEPVTSTLRNKRENCLNVLCQGNISRWNKYKKEGYEIQPVKLVANTK